MFTFSRVKVASSLMTMMVALSSSTVVESSSSSAVVAEDQFSLYFAKSQLTNTTKPAGCLYDPDAKSCTIVAQNVNLYQDSRDSATPAGHLRSVCRKHSGLPSTSIFGGEEVPGEVASGDIHCVYIFEFEGTTGQLGMDGYLKMNNTEFLPATLYENYGTEAFEDIENAQVSIVFNVAEGDIGTGRFDFTNMGYAAPAGQRRQPKSIDLSSTVGGSFSTLASF